MAVCPSAAINSILNIRNMSPLNSRRLKPATPDSDGCSRPSLSDPCDVCAVSWKTRPGGGRQGTDWLICQMFTDKIRPSGCYLESCWGSIVRRNGQTRMLCGVFFFSKLLLLYRLLTGFCHTASDVGGNTQMVLPQNTLIRFVMMYIV